MGKEEYVLLAACVLLFGCVTEGDLETCGFALSYKNSQRDLDVCEHSDSVARCRVNTQPTIMFVTGQNIENWQNCARG